ncbi:DUF389 domain-containing protein [Synechococcus sp. CCY9202]|uniref:DUF389 domain-containing protein n=1 Tax=Synechococcus sp. CCY9202 TaxID=174698 RepID=UPI002B1F461A|nr:DUF389 domain-containing protein [Synechococcus sp. CCY9202]MEA5423265.1 DUF389 domain-containing protein [Synechococcus sp. CCY9202]
MPPDLDDRKAPSAWSRGDAPDNPFLKRLRREFEADARLSQVFLVLSVGASLIATFGLLSNSAAVVIGAMVVAPWILPLQAIAYGILRGRFNLVLRALITLMLGVTTTVILSVGIGRLLGFATYGSEVLSRTNPNLLDLAIALVAGALAIYAKLRRDAVSSLAGLAIAVALVPPVCSMGLVLASGDFKSALGAGLLFVTNLLGILSGALVALAVVEPSFRLVLLRSRLGLTSLGLTALLLVPLTGSLVGLLRQARQGASLRQVEQAIAQSLRNRTITLGRDAQLVGVNIDWAQNPPLIRAYVRVTDPTLPTPAQVAAVQKFINSQQPIRYRLVVQKSAIVVVGPEAKPNPSQKLPIGSEIPPPPLREGDAPIPRIPPPPAPPPVPDESERQSSPTSEASVGSEVGGSSDGASAESVPKNQEP